jgi:hypothetical protein
MKRNPEAKCDNCPYASGGKGRKRDGCFIVDCLRTGLIHSRGGVCSHHPNFYGFASAKCGQCAWTGRTMNVGEDKTAYCRRNSWGGCIVRTDTPDEYKRVKVIVDAGLVMLDSPACPAFVPRCDEQEADQCASK